MRIVGICGVPLFGAVGLVGTAVRHEIRKNTRDQLALLEEIKRLITGLQDDGDDVADLAHELPPRDRRQVGLAIDLFQARDDFATHLIERSLTRAGRFAIRGAAGD